MADYTQQLAGFLIGLCYQDLPPAILAWMEELPLGWLGLALAGRGQRPIPLFERYAERMGPADGSTQVLSSRRRSLPYFTTLVSDTASHMVEQDDLHSSSVLHPATVVFPTTLATTQDLGRSGVELILTAVAGYEAGIRIGELLDRSHYRMFRTTVTIGTLVATVATGKLVDFDRECSIGLLGSTGTQTAGLWEFPRDTADSKQLHTAKAAADGLLAAYLTVDGLGGARHILEGEQGMAAGMSSDADPKCLVDRLGNRWVLLGTSFKFHASCRHTHPTADTLLALMQREGLDHSQIVAVTTRVHQGAIDVLDRVVEPQTVHQVRLFMSTVLGLIAVCGKANLSGFRRHALSDPRVAVFRERVEIRLNPEVGAAYSQRWLGRVEVLDNEGRRRTAAIDEPKGDPGNTLSRDELTDEFHRLLTSSGVATDTEAEILIQRTQGLRQAPSVAPLI